MKRIGRVMLAASCALISMAAITAKADLDQRQGKLMAHNCLQCHARPNIGVPMMGNSADWTKRNKQGIDKLLTNVVYGIGGMPPLGYCSACSEQDFRAMIQAMSGIEAAAK